MCGIAAISLSPSSTIPVRQLAHELLLHSEERGKVASGIGWAYGGTNFYTKDPKPGGHLSLKVLPKDARTVIVHTRNATYGDPSDNDNNHPVTDPKEEIILVHNGVIANHESIRLEEKDVAFAEVDSSVIPWLIANEGTAGLAQLDGWAALAWLDKQERDAINLARLRGNAPMVVVYLEDGSIVMGSTFPIIHASLIRVGHGDAIIGGYEVPDHTHIRVRHGQVDFMSNITPYSYTACRYKKGKTMTHAEKQRLEKITNGDAVSYGKDTPVHAQPTTGGTTPAKATSGGPSSTYSYGYRPTGSTVVHASGPVSTTPEAYKPTGDGPKSDPLAGFKPRANPAPMSTVSKVSKGDGKPKGFPTPPEHPIPRYLEARLTYWVKFVDGRNSYYEDMPFVPADYEDDGYLYNNFVDLCEQGRLEGYIDKWGAYDKDGVRRWTEHFLTVRGEAEALEAIAKELPPVTGGRRKKPKETTHTGVVHIDPDDIDPDDIPIPPGGEVPMWHEGMTNEEWEAWCDKYATYGG